MCIYIYITLTLSHTRTHLYIRICIGMGVRLTAGLRLGSLSSSFTYHWPPVLTLGAHSRNETMAPRCNVPAAAGALFEYTGGGGGGAGQGGAGLRELIVRGAGMAAADFTLAARFVVCVCVCVCVCVMCF